MTERLLPDDPLGFIRQCVLEKRLLWTYHVNMRMERRSIPRELIMASTETYEVIEAYPDDKYLPSYLVWATHEGVVFHVLFATDVVNRNARVVTAYHPSIEEWDQNLKKRKEP
jgi:hypothetical protein